ncbi:MAG: FHA domain-containing protein [Gemmatimonadales bacterium]
MLTASLTPLPPDTGAPSRFVANRPVTIGSDPASRLAIDSAGVTAHHATVERRDGGWWLRAIDGPVELNGAPLLTPTRLRDRDQIRIGGHDFEFASGEKRTRRMAAADRMARPHKRRYGGLPRPERNVSFAAVGSVVMAVLLVAGAAVVAWYGIFRATRGIVALDDRQSAELDSLLSVADDHVERGGTLLELGLGDGAAQEFAQAVNTLSLSDLRNNPLVKPRIRSLEATVGIIYRERRLAVPDNYARATSPLSADQLKTASLTVDGFAAQFQLMAAMFRDEFGHALVVTGRDHPEHVALYGKGGAIDLSIKDMNPGEVGFVIHQAHSRHIRIKDFSRDSVLRREVQAAIKSGLLFEAGTGLHLHIDRFANRRDKWTTLRSTDSNESLQLAEGWAPFGRFAERRRDPR